MSNALRRVFVAPDTPAELLELGRPPGASPVHDLQDRLVTHFASDHVVPQMASGTLIAPPVRMAIIFWTAVSAWAIIALAIYGAARLIGA